MKPADDKARVKKGERQRLFKRLKNMLFHLFEPEEVEVSFSRKGNHMVYTYHKIGHRQLA
jgi:hypothetical protein